jgi:hypothetical protein
MSALYIFYKKDKTNERVIIYADSYMEAKDALFALNNYADLVYDLNEYKLQHVNIAKLFNELHLDETYDGYPYILTEENYKNLEDAIEDKLFSNIHNTHVLTKGLAEKMKVDDINKFPFYSLDEFKRSLQQMQDNRDKLKNEIDNMITHVGEIWYMKINTSNLRLGAENYIYGRSRKEVLDTLYEYDKTIKNNGTYLLITSYPNYTNDDIKRYEKFVTYIKEHNIKKLPFITNY